MINVINNNYNSGFHLTFENGLTISIQIGSGNYCSNRKMEFLNDSNTNSSNTSIDAEIAIWNDRGNWFDFGSDTVIGYVPTDDIADWIYRVKNATSIETI